MALDVVDGAGNAAQLASDNVAGVHTTHHKVTSLPGTVESDTSQSRGFLATLAGAIASGRMAVDLTSTVTTYLSHLVTIAGAITAARMAVNLDSTSLAKLDSIIAGQAVPTGGPKFGFVTGIGGSNANFASKTLSRGTTVYNLDAVNNLLISMGTPGAADVDTLTIKPGLSAFIACTNANAFNMRSSAGTVSACHSGS